MDDHNVLPTNEWIRDKLEETLLKQGLDDEGDLYAICDELRESFLSNGITTLEACTPCLLAINEILVWPTDSFDSKAPEIFHKHCLTKDQIGAVTSILAWIITGLKFDMRDPDDDDDDTPPYTISPEKVKKVVDSLIKNFLEPKVLDRDRYVFNDDSFVGIEKENKVIVKKAFVGF